MLAGFDIILRLLEFKKQCFVFLGQLRTRARIIANIGWESSLVIVIFLGQLFILLLQFLNGGLFGIDLEFQTVVFLKNELVFIEHDLHFLWKTLVVVLRLLDFFHLLINHLFLGFFLGTVVLHAFLKVIGIEEKEMFALLNVNASFLEILELFEKRLQFRYFLIVFVFQNFLKLMNESSQFLFVFLIVKIRTESGLRKVFIVILSGLGNEQQHTHMVAVTGVEIDILFVHKLSDAEIGDFFAIVHDGNSQTEFLDILVFCLLLRVGVETAELAQVAERHGFLFHNVDSVPVDISKQIHFIMVVSFLAVELENVAQG